MLEKEAEDRINMVLASLKDGGVNSVRRQDAYNFLSQEITNIPHLGQYDVSDIWHGATNRKVHGKWGHTRADYWKYTSVGTEGFANMGRATVNCPESLAMIQEYFPQSYDIFLEMIKMIGGL